MIILNIILLPVAINIWTNKKEIRAVNIICGLISAIIAYLIERNSYKIANYGLIVIFIEECLKFISYRINNDSKAACIGIGIGFAIMENILVSFENGTGIFLERMLLNTLPHCLIGEVYDELKSRNVVSWISFVIAILLHASFNLYIEVNNVLTLIILVIYVALQSLLRFRSI